MKAPQWIPKEAIITVHNSLLSRYGGPAGIREPELLESALAQPQQLFHYQSSSLYELAACYAHGIAKNHPFVDGNKRTSFMSAYLFLRMNGLSLQAPETEAVTQTLALAASTISQENYALWLEESCRQS